MKKILAIFVSLLALSSITQAQSGGFIGGGISSAYSGKFSYQTTIHGGYAFNDKIAIMAMGGIAAAVTEGDGIVLGETGAYVRFTPWHNDFLFIDIKSRVELVFSDEIEGIDVGVVPSLRFRLSPTIELFTDVAFAGVRYIYGYWMPCIGVSSHDAVVGVNFLF